MMQLPPAKFRHVKDLLPEVTDAHFPWDDVDRIMIQGRFGQRQPPMLLHAQLFHQQQRTYTGSRGLNTPHHVEHMTALFACVPGLTDACKIAALNASLHPVIKEAVAAPTEEGMQYPISHPQAGHKSMHAQWESYPLFKEYVLQKATALDTSHIPAAPAPKRIRSDSFPAAHRPAHHAGPSHAPRSNQPASYLIHAENTACLERELNPHQNDN
jgi:hypothetical protein